MNSRAGRIEKKLTDDRNEFKLLQRKKKVENILRSKRLPPSPPKAQIEPQPQFVPEVKEDQEKVKRSVGFVNQRHTLKETVIRSDVSTVKKKAI